VPWSKLFGDTRSACLAGCACPHTNDILMIQRSTTCMGRLEIAGLAVRLIESLAQCTELDAGECKERGCLVAVCR
jgi:hypothetical protein